MTRRYLLQKLKPSTPSILRLISLPNASRNGAATTLTSCCSAEPTRRDSSDDRYPFSPGPRFKGTSAPLIKPSSAAAGFEMHVIDAPVSSTKLSFLPFATTLTTMRGLLEETVIGIVCAVAGSCENSIVLWM